ncbi:hypothetical protein Rsub_12236 [Raphidocelis subcapitata]|uniref:Uncharacterized protein n=1 Tax=Raphidocelis subcapitata TaxID=307507 RepID=A0A2V0PJA2_9CHLO|nr:hypothetical protein Rsub_12236 [Raphidocelis subcapitata]|eukprot:GBF99796.1 hypothetical protein Rsub_12236 [Raphidocelis subcapitata]
MDPAFLPGFGGGGAAPLPPRPAAVPSPSARMGQLLLQGWQMLADSCDDCAVPLMREPGAPGSRRDLCVGCDRWFFDGEPVADGPAAAAAPAAAQARPAAPAPATAAAGGGGGGAAAPAPRLRSAARPAAQSASDRAADLLSERMLQGWALLDHTCPLCATPLMRERGSRQVMCVACDLPVGRPGGDAAAEPAPAAQAPAPAAAAADADAAAAPCESPRPAARSTAAPARSALALAPAAAEAAPAPSAAPASSAGGPPLALAAALSGAQAALTGKVREVSAAIAAAPVDGAGGVAGLRDLVALLGEALAALDAVRRAQQQPQQQQ